MADEAPDDKTVPRPEPDELDPATLQSIAPDPNDEIPVPIAMSPAEVDERAQVVETLRERERRAEEGEPPAEPPPSSG